MKYVFALVVGLILASTSQATHFHRGRVAFVGFRTYSSYAAPVAIVNAPIAVGNAYGNAYGGSCGAVNSFNGVQSFQGVQGDCGVQNFQSFQGGYSTNNVNAIGVNYGVRTFRNFGRVGGFGVNHNFGVGVRGFNSFGVRQRTVGFDRFGRPIVRNVRVGFGY
jgi:hypothetical protein